jgi:hypothetical protein
MLIITLEKLMKYDKRRKHIGFDYASDSEKIVPTKKPTAT